MPRKKKAEPKRGRPILKTALNEDEVGQLQAMLDEDPLPADAVRVTRNAMGLSQTAFAETVGAKRRTVQDWENGLRSCKGAWRLLVVGHAKKIKATAAA